MPKYTALALGAAFLIAGIVFIVFDHARLSALRSSPCQRAFDTMFVFAVRAEHQRERAISQSLAY